jgi:hypothetical protein
MSLDLEEIRDMPEFEHDIDPHTMSKLSESDRFMAVTLSKLRQEVRWTGERALLAYNLGVQNAKYIDSVKAPSKFLLWIGALVVAGWASTRAGIFFR